MRLRWYTGSSAEAVAAPGTFKSCDWCLFFANGSCGAVSSSLSVSDGGEDGLGMGMGVAASESSVYASDGALRQALADAKKEVGGGDACWKALP